MTRHHQVSSKMLADTTRYLKAKAIALRVHFFVSTVVDLTVLGEHLTDLVGRNPNARIADLNLQILLMIVRS